MISDILAQDFVVNTGELLLGIGAAVSLIYLFPKTNIIGWIVLVGLIVCFYYYGRFLSADSIDPAPRYAFAFSKKEDDESTVTDNEDTETVVDETEEDTEEMEETVSTEN